MPELKDTLRSASPEGFVPIPRLAPPSPVSLPGQDNSFKVNPIIRCPLPPINAGPDTLRQFNDGNTNIPRRRVLPLPVTNGIGGGTVVTNTTVISSAGSGSSSTNTFLSAKTVTYTAPLIPSGSSGFSALNVSAKSYQLVSCTANGPCEVRIYGSSSAMATDASRLIDSPLPAELANGLVTDIVLDTAPYKWFWENRVGCNSDSPQVTNLYVSVTNLGIGSAQPQISLVLLPLES
jgi:hypothetical protein